MTQQDVIAAIRRDDKLFAEIIAGMSQFVREIEQGGGVMDDFEHHLANIVEGNEDLRQGVWALREAMLNGISLS
jgi:hypothetical protein